MLEPQSLPTENIQLSSPSDNHKRNIKDDDPGIMLMTDLRRTTPYKIAVGASLSEANDKMVACEVRLLFVTDTQNNLMGIITLTDLSGEKPLLFANQTRTPIVEVTAQDIMTPLSRLEGIPLEQIMKSKISDIVEAQKKCHRLHMLVVDDSEDTNYICGIISVSRTSRLLGIELSPSLQANSFAEIKEALKES